MKLAKDGRFIGLHYVRESHGQLNVRAWSTYLSRFNMSREMARARSGASKHRRFRPRSLAARMTLLLGKIILACALASLMPFGLFPLPPGVPEFPE